MTTCIVGYKGNMGRRYASILNYLDIPWIGADVGDGIPSVEKYIVVTPTNTHIDIIRKCKSINKDSQILCEKPITTNIKEFSKIPREFWHTIFMVNQYQYYPRLGKAIKPEGMTLYDYYNSGSDGLAWDCIQLIHLAKNKKKVILRNNFPVWKALINGFELNKGFIDSCYVEMLGDFLEKGFLSAKLWNLFEAYKAHEEVLSHLEAQ